MPLVVVSSLDICCSWFPSIVCVCVFHLYRCKTSIMCRGQRDLQLWPLPTKLHTGWSGKRTCFILYIESRPWAHLRRSWGGHIFYRCCFILSLSTVIIRIYIIFILRVRFNWSVFCTSVAFHIKIRNDRSEQVCDSCWIRQGGMNPSGESLSKLRLDTLKWPLN